MKKLSALRTCIVLAFLLAISPALYPFSHYSQDSTFRTVVEPMIMRLDSMSNNLLTREKFFINEDDLKRLVDLTPEQLPHYSDAQLEKRLKLIPSVIHMTYNKDVRAFMDMFLYKKRNLMTHCIANAQIYFPMFEEVLERKHLPIELKYLPIVESAFNPLAVSSAGAAGLWQIMPGTGTQLGLQLNSLIDERRDPLKATEAACDYLKGLYDLYGDWHLALAAYNAGPGYVNKAIARAGGVKNFWAIQAYLPAETRSYVPIYIAACYAMQYADEYKLESAKPRRDLYAVDTVIITNKVSLKHVCEILGIPLEEMEYLNPSLKADIVPNTTNGYPLNLPVNYLAFFEKKRTDILNDQSVLETKYDYITTYVQRYIWYKVRKSDNMAKIAAHYSCSASEIKRLNHLKGSAVKYGQKLKLLVNVPVQVPTLVTNNTATATTNIPNPNIPIVKPDFKAIDTVTEVDTVDMEEEASASVKKDEKPIAPTPKTTQVVVEKDKVAANTPPSKTIYLDEKCSCVYHTVQPGDTLWSIASMYDGITVAKLKADNNIGKMNPIRVGDKIKIVL